jgi:glycosyltransferase involved in cell wall biosynthesis
LKKNHLKESVLLKGHMTHDEICYYYNIASILINAGASGGLPNVIIEAIASKLPVIATDTGATKDFVNENTRTGILIKDFQSETIELAILKILKNKNVPDKFDQKILEQFSFDNFGKELIQIYEEANKRFQEL